MDPLTAWGQKKEEERIFQILLEQTNQLVVMVTVMYDEEPVAGAGIIFGYEKDRLLVATARHVVQRGTQQPTNIWIRLKTGADSLKATVLYDKNELDLAVLSVEGLAKHGINPCVFSFDKLRIQNDLEPGNDVFLLGNPYGLSWDHQVVPDKISRIGESQIEFQSTFIRSGHSGGGLVDRNACLLGMITADEPPTGRAKTIDAILQQLKAWGLPVMLRTASSRGAAYTWPLHQAAGNGDTVEIRKLLALCTNPNERDFYYRTPLYYAASKGNIQAVSILLKAGASPNAYDFNGYVPLHLAIEYDHPESVKVLVKAGASVNGACFNQELTPLQLACSKKNINREIVVSLIEAGADVNSKNETDAPIQNAVNSNNIEIVRTLIKAGAAVRGKNAHEFTPLLSGIRVDNPEIIQLLIQSGADVNAEKSFNGGGPLHMAALMSNQIEMIKLLLKAGADVNARDNFGSTPLHYLVSRDSYKLELKKLLEFMTVLLQEGADANAKDASGKTVPSTAKNYFRNDPNALQAIERLLHLHSIRLEKTLPLAPLHIDH